MQQVLILGGTTFDHIVSLPVLPPPVPQTIHQAPLHEGTGSTGAGKALALTKLGVPNTLVSAVGDDAYGHHIINDLAAQGIDLRYRFDPAGTERHINLMDAQGGRISLFVTQSSEEIAFEEAALMGLIQAADFIVLNIIPYCRPLIPLLAGYEGPIWTDLHDYDGINPYHQPFINAAQFIHLSSDNLPDYRTTMERLRSAGKELIICTHGRAGATLLTAAGEWLEQPAFPVAQVVDANGAGDSFFAGFLYGWLRQEPLATCLHYGAVCGAACVTTRGLVADGLSPALLRA